MVSIIVAHDANQGIGKNNQLPWHIPSDLKYFKALTSGCTVIMGRKTFESIGTPLTGRRNIVVTSNEDFSFYGVEVANSLTEAFEMASDDEVFVIGGQQIYEQALPFVERLYITRIKYDFDVDSHFPIYNEDFMLVECERPDEENGYQFVFETWVRLCEKCWD